MSCSSVTTTTWTCDLCGGTQGDPMGALYYPLLPSSTMTSASFPSYDRIDICDGCTRHYLIADVLAWFAGRLAAGRAARKGL